MSKTSDRYVKVVAWSEEDQCYIGRCPGLMLGGVHGSDEQAVYADCAKPSRNGSGSTNLKACLFPKRHLFAKSKPSCSAEGIRESAHAAIVKDG